MIAKNVAGLFLMFMGGIISKDYFVKRKYLYGGLENPLLYHNIISYLANNQVFYLVALQLK